MVVVNKNEYFFDTETKQFGSRISGSDLMFKRDWRKLILSIAKVNPENFYIYKGAITSKKGLKYTLIKYYDPSSNSLVDLEIKLPDGRYKIEPHTSFKNTFQLKRTFDIEYESGIVEKFEKIHKVYVDLLFNHPVLNKNKINEIERIEWELFPLSRLIYQIGETDRYTLYADITSRTDVMYRRNGEEPYDRIAACDVYVEGSLQTIDISFVSLSKKDNETIYNVKSVKMLHVEEIE